MNRGTRKGMIRMRRRTIINLIICLVTLCGCTKTKALLKSGSYIEVSWEDLQTKPTADLADKDVAIVGFATSVSDTQEPTERFYVTPSPVGSLTADLPPPDQLILVETKPGKEFTPDWNAYWFRGHLEKGSFKDDEIEAGYRLKVESWEIYRQQPSNPKKAS